MNSEITRDILQSIVLQRMLLEHRIQLTQRMSNLVYRFILRDDELAWILRVDGGWFEEEGDLAIRRSARKETRAENCLISLSLTLSLLFKKYSSPAISMGQPWRPVTAHHA